MLKKRCMLLLLALMLLFTACATAGKDETDKGGGDAPAQGAGETAGETAQERVTLSLFVMESPKSTISPTATPIGAKIMELTGVDLKIEYLVGTDVRQKASLMIAGGDYPDMISSGDAAGDYIAAEAFLPLNDYIENSKSMKNWYQPYQLELLKSREDGNMYFISTGHPNEDRVYPAAGYYLSMDLLAQNDYPVVKDFYAWQDLIIEYCRDNPTVNGQPVIGFTAPTEGWRASGVQYGGSRFLAGFPNDGLTVVDQETLECKIIMYQDFHKEFFKMINRFWQEGIADKEMFMQTNDQYNAKIASGRVVGLYDQRHMYVDAINALEGSGNTSSALVAFPVVLPGIETERYRGPRVFNAGSGLSITTSCKDPDRAFAFLDRMSEEDIQILNRWGIEGTDYSVGAQGIFERTPEQWAQVIDAEYEKKQGLSMFAWFAFAPPLDTFSSGSPVDPTKTEEYAAFKYKDYEKEFLGNYADRDIDNFCDFFNPSYDSFYDPGYNVRIKIPTDDPRKQAGEKALEITREYAAVLAQCAPEKFDALWDEFVGKLNQLPLKEYEELATQMTREGSAIYKSAQ